jgi:glycosyltransferase involved in cell wall biosynthesis
VRNKRVDLICSAIGTLAKSAPAMSFEWHHFGDGDRRTEVAQLAAQMPPNAKAILHGHQDLQTIMKFYASHPVDVFVSASVFEGGAPVAIQEACSSGIPIVATDSGGVRDIVGPENGFIVSQDGARAGLVSAIKAFLDEPPAHKERLRSGSRAVWSENFDASRNAKAFAERLKAVA